MNQIDLRVVKTKTLLLQTLLELLKKKTLSDITVAEICRRANINRSTFYNHYMNVDELLLEYFTALVDELGNDYLPILDNLIVPGKQDMTPLFDHILKHREFYDILLSDNVPMKYRMQFNQSLVKFPYDVIKKNIRNDIDIDLYLTFCSSATMGMIYHWKETGYAKTSEEMSHQILQYFTRV